MILIPTNILLVHPAHIAFVLLNEGDPNSPNPTSLFASVIQKAGGDLFPLSANRKQKQNR